MCTAVQQVPSSHCYRLCLSCDTEHCTYKCGSGNTGDKYIYEYVTPPPHTSTSTVALTHRCKRDISISTHVLHQLFLDYQLFFFFFEERYTLSKQVEAWSWAEPYIDAVWLISWLPGITPSLEGTHVLTVFPLVIWQKKRAPARDRHLFFFSFSFFRLRHFSWEESASGRVSSSPRWNAVVCTFTFKRQLQGHQRSSKLNRLNLLETLENELCQEDNPET